VNDEPQPREGWVADELRAELPGLGLVSVACPAPAKLAGRSPAGVRERLDTLSLRLRGAQATVLRQRPVPHAYRVFFRHVGLDPDTTRVPVEAAVVERLVHGGFASHGPLEDALTIALVETGVPLWALDAAAVRGALWLRLSRAGERLGGEQDDAELPPERIVVADAHAPLAPLFGEPAGRVVVTRRTRELLLFAVRVEGVSVLEVQEALWSCVEVLRAC
jgi:DNA/RNA-binding domain of Phe-tRNA-synthetase-like protein